MEERFSEAGRGYQPHRVINPQTAHKPAPVTDSAPPRGDLYRNFGDGYTRAFELALTPAIFGGLGYALDSWIGIVPVFTLVFALVALVTLLARTWAGYVQRMEVLEKAGPWASR